MVSLLPFLILIMSFWKNTLPPAFYQFAVCVKVHKPYTATTGLIISKMCNQIVPMKIGMVHFSEKNKLLMLQENVLKCLKHLTSNLYQSRICNRLENNYCPWENVYYESKDAAVTFLGSLLPLLLHLSIIINIIQAFVIKDTDKKWISRIIMLSSSTGTYVCFDYLNRNLWSKELR